MDIRLPMAALALFALIIAAACYVMASSGEMPPESGQMSLSVQSPAFKEGDKIPVTYTCDGADMSPPISWDHAPSGVKTYALIVDDPDAPRGVFTHWVIFNIPGASMGLPENVPKDARLDDGAIQGKNDFGRTGYGGPCPPAGKLHRYQFHVYALDSSLNVGSGASKQDVLHAMQGHVLANGRLMGVYKR